MVLTGNAAFSLPYFLVWDHFPYQGFVKLHGDLQLLNFTNFTVLLLSNVDSVSTCLQGEAVYQLAVELLVIFSLLFSLSIGIWHFWPHPCLQFSFAPCLLLHSCPSVLAEQDLWLEKTEVHKESPTSY